jgi:hypothetical protein
VHPEFFFDRCLGKSVARELRNLGWKIHEIADHFPRDAQDVQDEVWTEYGLERGWIPLCKDGRIRGRDVEREPLERLGAVLFYLDNQQLLIKDMVTRIHQSQRRIHNAVARGGPALYAIGASGIRKTWP